MNFKGEKKNAIKSISNIAFATIISIWVLVMVQPLLYTLVSFLDNWLWLNNICSFVLFLLAFIFITYKYLIKLKSWSGKIYCALLIIYVIFRLITSNSSWNFTSWTFIKFYNLSYFDLPFGVVLLLIIITERRKWKNRNEKKSKKNGPSDNPVEKEEEDLLGYYKYAESLLKRILESKELYSDGSYSIGINGKWGQGKSSFVNLMKCALEKGNDKQEQSFSDKAVWIEFNPWRSNDEKQIIKDFIKELESSLSPIDPWISVNAQKYLDVLARADLGYFSKVLNLFMPHKYDSVDYRFTKLNDNIIQIGKPIIIVIEDIDRLVATEILQVLKLIRNTANFMNCIFLVPYDSDYIIKMLKKGGVKYSEDYLAKIINTNYSLPRLSQEAMNEYYIKILNNSLLIVHDDKNEKSIRNFISDTNLHFTLREIKYFAREVNSYSVLLMDKGNLTLYLYDYLLIRLLEVKNPSLYRGLYFLKDREKLLKIVSDDVYLLNISNKGLATESDYISYSEEQKSFFNENNKNLSLRIMKLLFSEERNRGRKHNHPFRLNLAVSINLYFENLVDDSFIVKSEFEQIFLLKKDEASTLLKEMEKRNEGALQRYLSFLSFNNEQEGLFIFDLCISLDRSFWMNAYGFAFPGSYWIKENMDDAQKYNLHKRILFKYLDNYNYDTSFERRYKMLLFLWDIFNEPDNNYAIMTNRTDDVIIKYTKIFLEHIGDFENYNDYEHYIYSIEGMRYSGVREKVSVLWQDFLKNHLESFITVVDKNSPSQAKGYLKQIFSYTGNQNWEKNYFVFLMQVEDQIKSQSWFIEYFDKVKKEYPIAVTNKV